MRQPLPETISFTMELLCARLVKPSFWCVSGIDGIQRSFITRPKLIFIFSYSKKERKKAIKAEQAEKRKNKIKKHVKKRKEKVSSTKKKWNIAKQLIIFPRNLSMHITELFLLFVIDCKIDSFLDLKSSFRNINDSNQVYISSKAFPSLSWPLSSRMH